MKKKFTLEIELDNKTMVGPLDVSNALTRSLEDDIDLADDEFIRTRGDIRDVNGRRVGTWKVKSKKPPNVFSASASLNSESPHQGIPSDESKNYRSHKAISSR